MAINVNVNNRAFNGGNNGGGNRGGNAFNPDDEYYAKRIKEVNRAAENLKLQEEIRYKVEKRDNIRGRTISESNYRGGRISEEEYKQEKSFFNKESNQNEDKRDKEIADIAKRQAELLEKILNAQNTNNKNSTVDSQRSNSEHGSLRGMYKTRSYIQNRRLDATTDEDREKYTKLLKQQDDKILRAEGKSPFLNKISDSVGKGGDIISSIANGGAMNIMPKLLGMLGPFGIAAAGIAGAAVGGMKIFESRKESENVLMPYRGQGNRGAISSEFTSISKDVSDYGISVETYANKRKELLLASGMSGSGSHINAMNALGLEKGYGINNVAQLSGNERQLGNSKSTADNIVAMLNVLGQIKESSIKPNDLTLANEKAMLMFRLQNNQKSSKDEINQRQILGTMSAGEKMGGAFSDDRAGDTWSQAFNSIKDGGNDNIRALKYQFAIKARPELGTYGKEGDLADYVEEGTDPKYLASVVEGLQNMSGGNSTFKRYAFAEAFKGMTPDSRKRLANMNKDQLNDLKNGADPKTMGIFSTEDAKANMEEQALTTEVWSEKAKNVITDAIVDGWHIIKGDKPKIEPPKDNDTRGKKH